MKLAAEITTIPQLLRNVVVDIHSENDTFLLEKVKGVWQEISFKQILDNADALSAYFLESGIQKGDRLALISENSPEYIYYDQALQQIGGVNVSIYPTLSEHEIEYILNDSGARTLLVGSPFLFKKILKIANNCPSLQLITTVFEGLDKHLPKTVINAKIIGFKELLQEGNSKIHFWKKQLTTIRKTVVPSDIASLTYTSGTSGTPKGVMLTHRNFVENVRAGLEHIPVIEKEDVFLSFLPLSHVFERTATYLVCCATGCKIAFAESLELLAKNMVEIKPTVLIAVPRLLERIHDKAMKNGTAGGGLRAKLFLRAIETGKRFRETKEAGKTPGVLLSLKQKIADQLVFRKIKEKTGGRLKFMISGGGALPKNIGEFFGNLGIKILEGYGLTETSPVVVVTEYNRQVYGTVGRVLRGIEIGIQNTETKEIITVQTYDSFDPDFECTEGEIIVRGHCVMAGYWNLPTETARAIDVDGWFHTEDIGRFYKGNLQITDRIKNILVSSFGKNVYPTPIENIYLKSQKIEQIFLIGDKREYLTAIIVPSKELLQEVFGLKEGFFQQTETFIEDQYIKDWIEDDLKQLSKELAKFERVRHFVVKRTPFSIESGEMTPTLKAKRKMIEKKYAEEIDKMYLRELEES